MKRISKSIMIFLVVMTGVNMLFAQRERTVNGVIWTKMKKEYKMYFITGYLNGLEKAENILDINVRVQKKSEFAFTEPFYIKRTREQINDYIPNVNNRINYLVELLDIFYTDKNNLKISYSSAIRIMLARQAGDIEKSDMWLQEARRKIARPGY